MIDRAELKHRQAPPIVKVQKRASALANGCPGQRNIKR